MNNNNNNNTMSLEPRDLTNEETPENVSTLACCLYEKNFEPTTDNLKDADSEDDEYQQARENKWSCSEKDESFDLLEDFSYRKRTCSIWDKFDNKTLKFKQYLIDRYETRSDRRRSDDSFECKKCGMAFVTYVALRLHMKKSHSYLIVANKRKKVRVLKVKKLLCQRFNDDF